MPNKVLDNNTLLTLERASGICARHPHSSIDSKMTLKLEHVAMSPFSVEFYFYFSFIFSCYCYLIMLLKDSTNSKSEASGGLQILSIRRVEIFL